MYLKVLFSYHKNDFKFSSNAAVCVVGDTGDLTKDRIQAIRLLSKCSASLATWPPASVFPFPLQM